MPLVPPYLCFLGGVSARQLVGTEAFDRARAPRVVLAAVMFVLGFATVFIAFGATATAFGQLVTQHLQWLGYIAGVIGIPGQRCLPSVCVRAGVQPRRGFARIRGTQVGWLRAQGWLGPERVSSRA